MTLHRTFHCPTGLHADDAVWLTLDGLAGVLRITLNDQQLDLTSDPTGTLRCEIRRHLVPRNAIAIELAVDHQRELDEVRAHIQRQVLATGLVRLEIEAGETG